MTVAEKELGVAQIIDPKGEFNLHLFTDFDYQAYLTLAYSLAH